MKSLVGFLTVLAVVLGGGSLLAWRERRRGEAHDELGSTAATLPLSLVEGRLVVLHPLFLGPLLAISGLVIVVIVVFQGDADVGEDSVFGAFVVVAIGLLGLVLASNRSASRARRDGTDELLRTVPTAARAHTAAQLLGSWMAALVVVAVGLVTWVVAHAMSRGLGPIVAWRWTVAEVAVIAVGATFAGVLLARWLPFPLAGAAGVVALIVLNNQLDHLHPRWRWLRAAPEPDFGGIFDVKPFATHLAFLVGLVVLGAGLALARHGLRASTVVAVVTGAAVVVATGWSMTRAPSIDEVAARAALLEDPTAHQTCRLRGRVRYCAYADYQRWIPVWRGAVEGVLQATPEPGRPAELLVVQRPAPGVASHLLPEVAAAIDLGTVWREDDAVHPATVLSVRWRHVEVAYQAAALIVGLPPARGHVGLCDAGGQARSLVAWWLAAHGGRDVRRWLTEQAKASPNTFVLADTVPDYEGPREHRAHVGSGGRAGDVAGALAVLALDDLRVRVVLGEHWDEVLDPATKSAAVFGWFGLPAPQRLPSAGLDASGACG